MPLRYPNGVTTAKKEEAWGEFILPDRSTAHVYKEDFDYFDTDNFDIATSSPVVFTLELVDQDGGAFTMGVPDPEVLDFSVSPKAESFLFETGKKLWFDVIAKVSGLADATISLGLLAPFTQFQNPPDTVRMTADSSGVQYQIRKDFVGQPVTLNNAVLVEDTNARFSYFYNGVDRIDFFFNGQFCVSAGTENLPDDEILVPDVFISINGLSAMTVDYIIVAKER